MTSAADVPTVSVVVPAYNAAWCVGKAIDSVLAQTYRDFEIIVVNDGSTDDTLAVLRGYGDAIRIVDQRNGGMSNARNAGIRAARGQFLAFLDSDDWWLPNKLGLQVQLLRSRPDLGFCSCTARVEDMNGRLLNLWQCPSWDGSFLAHLFGSGADVPGSCSAVVARRALVTQVGAFDETLRGAEDPDLWIRLAAVSGYACLPEPMVVVLRRAGSVSRNLEAMRDSTLSMLRKNRPLLPAKLQGAYWRRCVASVHGDYAKWRYREGQRGAAMLELCHLFRLAPVARGRLGLGLLRDMLLDRPL
ncbi:MAG: glycosyltransferase [Polyangiaceae bacterium]|jgi:glycosyltransferase involved in cell wall biosynthesis|nr:glycosyltransferase [Polyangiaceae bacterium]